GRSVEARLLQNGRGKRHKYCRRANLQDCNLLKGKSLAGAAQKNNLESEAKGAANAEYVAAIHVGKVGQPLSASRDSHQEESYKCQCNSYYPPKMDSGPPEKHQHHRH